LELVWIHFNKCSEHDYNLGLVQNRPHSTSVHSICFYHASHSKYHYCSTSNQSRIGVSLRGCHSATGALCFAFPSYFTYITNKQIQKYYQTVLNWFGTSSKLVRKFPNQFQTSSKPVLNQFETGLVIFYLCTAHYRLQYRTDRIRSTVSLVLCPWFTWCPKIPLSHFKQLPIVSLPPWPKLLSDAGITKLQ
jgi:hypothetical protein